LSWTLAAGRQIRRGRDGEEIDLPLVDNVQQGIRCAVSDTGKVCSALYVQTVAEVDVSDLAWRALFHDTNDTQLLSQANDNDTAISRIQILAIQVTV
jgi:hypothetical protein